MPLAAYLLLVGLVLVLVGLLVLRAGSPQDAVERSTSLWAAPSLAVVPLLVLSGLALAAGGLVAVVALLAPPWTLLPAAVLAGLLLRLLVRCWSRLRCLIGWQPRRREPHVPRHARS